LKKNEIINKTYKIMRMIGAGSFGQIYLAVNVHSL
jgi:serine/threonine protein kinase